MKVQGSVNPKRYTLELIPREPGLVMIRFNENAHEITTDDGTLWEYDEYRLKLPEGITAIDVETYHDEWLKEAKAKEAPTPEQKLQLAVAELGVAAAQSKTDMQLAIAELAATMTGGTE